MDLERARVRGELGTGDFPLATRELFPVATARGHCVEVRVAVCFGHEPDPLSALVPPTASVTRTAHPRAVAQCVERLQLARRRVELVDVPRLVVACLRKDERGAA